MSTFLNGADVILGKVYRGAGVTFSAGDIYKSGNNVYRFCLLNGSTDAVVIDGMALSGSASSAGLSSTNVAALAAEFHGIALVDDKGANATKVTSTTPSTGIWAQIGGRVTNKKGAFCIPHSSTANMVQGSIYIGDNGSIIANDASPSAQLIGQQNTDETSHVNMRNFCAYRTSVLTDNLGAKVTAATLDGWHGFDASLLSPATAVGSKTDFAVTGTTVAVVDGAGDVYGIIADPTAGPGVAVAMTTFDELDSLPSAASGGNIIRDASATYVSGLTFAELTNSTGTVLTGTV